METLPTICLLVTFVAKGASLQCPVCETAGRNCKGAMQTCSSEYDTCAIILSERSMGKQNNTKKMCGKSNMCDKGLAVLNMGNGKNLSSHVSCCVGEECKMFPTPLPGRNSTFMEEKRKCPACYSENNDCKEETIECSKTDEIYCAESYYQTLSAEKKPVTTVLKGCANKAFCDNRHHLPLGTFLPMGHCKLASGSARIIQGLIELFTPVCVGLLLVIYVQH